jgi:hypothetical protein
VVNPAFSRFSRFHPLFFLFGRGHRVLQAKDKIEILTLIILSHYSTKHKLLVVSSLDEPMENSESLSFLGA